MTGSAESGRSGKDRGGLRIFLAGAIGVCTVMVALALWIWLYALSPLSSEQNQPSIVYIPPGTGLTGIQDILVQEEVMDDDIRFPLLARITGTAARLKAGEYSLRGDITPLALLEKLAKGDIYYRSVTIPEGATLARIGELLHDRLGYDLGEFMGLVHEKEFIASLDLTFPSLEGYLFPDTYYITRGQSMKEVVAMMVDRFRKIYAELVAEAGPDNPRLEELSSHEIVILASIVEKETGFAAERPLIAAVFLNRLKKRMRLQADPTVIYGLPDFDGNLTKKDLRTPTPYNTYTRPGLPAGPIANPGKESLRAVLNPADVPYLYFVAGENGSHYFSITLREHNRAVYRYQKKRESR